MSVRAKATIAATVIVGIALAAAGLGLIVVQRGALVQHLDEVADLRANDVAALALDGTLPPALATASDDDEKVLVLDAEGRVVAETPGEGAPITFEPTSEDAEMRTVDGWRVAARRVDASEGRLFVYVSTSLEPVDESVALLRLVLAIGGPGLLALVAVTTWLLVGRALAPVESIRREVAAISEQSLSHRVPVPRSGDEIERLGTTMNTMLDRLEEASVRQRRFVGDASHELRTPLAAMRAELELEGDSELLQTTLGMERLVNNLLYLARADAVTTEGVTTEGTLIDLDDVVLEEAAAHHGRVPVDTTAVSGAAVRGHRDDLARVVRNLLDNADRHARSSVRVSVSSLDGDVTMTVADDGPGIPEADRERVFERFTRLDGARDRSSGRAGLGLAIARAIITAHRGTIVASDDGVVVRLPAA